MNLYCESDNINDYLLELNEVDYPNPMIHLKSLNKWIRLDARGNKKGIEAQFSIEKKLAFSINEKLDEKDSSITNAPVNERFFCSIVQFKRQKIKGPSVIEEPFIN